MLIVIMLREKLAGISITWEEIILHWPIRSTKEHANVLTTNEEDRVNRMEEGTMEEGINFNVKIVG